MNREQFPGQQYSERVRMSPRRYGTITDRPLQ